MKGFLLILACVCVNAGSYAKKPVALKPLGSHLSDGMLYMFRYTTSDLFRHEEGYANGAVKGSYSFRSPEGRNYVFNYQAGHDGFQVKGDALPKPYLQAGDVSLSKSGFLNQFNTPKSLHDLYSREDSSRESRHWGKDHSSSESSHQDSFEWSSEENLARLAYSLAQYAKAKHSSAEEDDESVENLEGRHKSIGKASDEDDFSEESVKSKQDEEDAKEEDEADEETREEEKEEDKEVEEEDHEEDEETESLSEEHKETSTLRTTYGYSNDDSVVRFNMEHPVREQIIIEDENSEKEVEEQELDGTTQNSLPEKEEAQSQLTKSNDEDEIFDENPNGQFGRPLIIPPREELTRAQPSPLSLFVGESKDTGSSSFGRALDQTHTPSKVESTQIEKIPLILKSSALDPSHTWFRSQKNQRPNIINPHVIQRHQHRRIPSHRQSNKNFYVVKMEGNDGGSHRSDEDSEHDWLRTSRGRDDDDSLEIPRFISPNRKRPQTLRGGSSFVRARPVGVSLGATFFPPHSGGKPLNAIKGQRLVANNAGLFSSSRLNGFQDQFRLRPDVSREDNRRQPSFFSSRFREQNQSREFTRSRESTSSLRSRSQGGRPLPLFVANSQHQIR